MEFCLSCSPQYLFICALCGCAQASKNAEGDHAMDVDEDEGAAEDDMEDEVEDEQAEE